MTRDFACSRWSLRPSRYPNAQLRVLFPTLFGHLRVAPITPPSIRQPKARPPPWFVDKPGARLSWRQIPITAIDWAVVPSHAQLPQRGMASCDSEFKIDRKLQLSGNTCFVWGGERRKRRGQRTVELVQCNNVSVVEKIKRLYDKIQLSMLAYFEELQDSQIL